MSTKNGKAATDRTKSQTKQFRLSQLEDRENIACAAYNRSRDAACDQLGESVVQWIAKVTYDLSVLSDELNRIHEDARHPGSLLGDVLDPQQLVRVMSFLDGAASAFSSIRPRRRVRQLEFPDLVGESKNLSRGYLDEQFAFVQANKDLCKAKAKS
ncbi:unnamed protein product [Gemmata massiliana]|uniref:Uncharacterized protein n=1 Tax=Gemmata massiliana TaxID=1210884 RepID=A0A6P2D3J3_9BACT|nr:hypothetical protein [Gemmata massiliana]VTR94022.1 unnamed protein product [Gemmata massiliana]